MRLSFATSLAVFYLVTTSSTVQSADNWPVPRGPAREPAPYRYAPSVWQQAPKEFREDASAVILYTGTTHIVEDDGVIETITHEVTRLNGRKGIEALGEYHSIYFDPSYQMLTLNEARVLKTDGSVVSIEPRHVQLRDVATDFQIYNQDKQLVISFPNLEVGDVYEVKWTVRGKNPEFGGKFFTRYTFGDDTYPVVRDELHVLTAPTQVFHHATVGGNADLTMDSHNGRTHYFWKVTNRPELPRDEDRPSKEEQRLEVACSTFASWAEVGRWKQKLRDECWECTMPVKKIVDDVTRGLTSPLDKARALTYWVRRHVRYVSRGPAGAGYTPHLPEQVLGNLYGDCKDQAQLLAVMLRNAGLDPYLATLGTLDDGQVVRDVPSPWGSHAILMVPIDGKDYWIDATVSQAAWDYLPRGDRDRVAYLTRGTELKLMRTPSLTFADNRIEQMTRIAVVPDGSTYCTRQSTHHGGSALSRRDALIEAPPGERRRLFSAELQDANHRSRLQSVQIDERCLNDFDQPVRIDCTFQIAKQFAGEATKDGSLSDGLIWSKLLAYTVDPERTTGLHLGMPLESIHRFVVELPLTLRLIDIPVAQEVTSRWGFIKTDVLIDPNNPRRLELTSHFRLSQVRVEPKDFAEFGQFQEDAGKIYRFWLSLRQTTELADAPTLELALALAPWSDPALAKTLGRLYLDNGRIASARRVLRTASTIHPQDRGLWALRVLAAESPADEEEIYVEMRRQFPKDAKIRVALGAVKVNRGDHVGARQLLEPLAASDTTEIRGLSHYQLARSYFQEGRSPAALKHLETAFQADPELTNDPEPLEFKARVHESLGQRREAITAYREVLALDGGAQDVLVPLIRLESKAGDAKVALDHLRHYTLAVGDDPAGLGVAAELHLEMNRLEDACELANRAVKAGAVTYANRVLGLASLQKNELEKAVFHLSRCPVDADVAAGLMQAYLGLGDFVKAQGAFEAAQAVEQATPALRQALDKFQALMQRREALWTQMHLPEERKQQAVAAIEHFLCAEIAYQNGKRPVATRILAPALAHDLPLGPAFALRGLLALEKGSLKSAAADAERAIRLSVADSRAFYVRGRVRLERGEAGALGDLEMAANLTHGQDGLILHWLATALAEAGRRDDALALQRRAVQARPGDVDLVEQLRHLEHPAR